MSDRRLVLGGGLLLAAALAAWGVAASRRSEASAPAPRVEAGLDLAPVPAVGAKLGAALAPRPPYPRAQADERPGEAAFRELTDEHLAQNEAELAAHQAREQLTRDEVRELTYTGLLATRTMDWDAVEQLTGHAIHPNARKYASDAMFEASDTMRRELRDQVAQGDAPEERWETIRRNQEAFLARYYELTGMTPELLDWLLWESVHDQRASATADAPPAPPAGGGGGNPVDRRLDRLPPPPPEPDEPPPPQPEQPPPPPGETPKG